MRDGLVGTRVGSPLGLLTLVASRAGLVAVLWPDDRPGRVPLGSVAADDASNPHIGAATLQLGDYFAGRRSRFDVSLDMRGTDFQQAVWRALAEIPYGETRSYGAVAAILGQPGASRAIGAANGRNPVSIIVPCHRVVGSKGSLTGFAGGLGAKRHLLALESGAGRLL